MLLPAFSYSEGELLIGDGKYFSLKLALLTFDILISDFCQFLCLIDYGNYGIKRLRDLLRAKRYFRTYPLAHKGI